MTDQTHIVTHFVPAPPGASPAQHAAQTQPSGPPLNLTLEDLAKACQAAARVGAKGDAGYLTPCAIVGSRSSSNAGPASLAFVDADDGAPDWTVLAEYEGFAWTTHSHRPDKPAWRIVIPFEAPVAHGALPSPWPGAHIRNRSQPAFLPTHPTDTALIEWRWLGGTKRLSAAASKPIVRTGATDSMLASAFEAAGWVIRDLANGTGVEVRCPWVSEHSDGEAGGTTVFFDDPDGQGCGKFYCSRTKCTGRTSRDALAVLRAIPAAADELRHWSSGLGGWRRSDNPFALAAPGGAESPAQPPAGGEWDPFACSLIGAPRGVEVALTRWRGDVRGRGLSNPELSNSKAVISWLALERGVSPVDLQRHFGPEAGTLATHLLEERNAPQVQAVGRLTRITELLSRADLRFNEMTLTVEIGGRAWSDSDTADARVACEQAEISDPDKPVSKSDVEECAKRVAMRHAYHPVREWLDALPEWDRVPRVDGLWSEYFGAASTRLNRALSACFLLGAVRRIIRPGCKVDMMPILYGPQGRFKSTAIAALAGRREFFSDAKLNFSHRAENAMTLAECWILEVAELEGFNRAEQNAVKAFTTVQIDRVLLPYARTKTQRERMSVMIGTTNEDQPLRDPTGNRRYPVIEIGRIDVAAITRDCEQLWAEALFRAATDEPHWLPAELEDVSAEVNEAHTQSDEAWLESLRKWLDNPTWLPHGSWKVEPFPTANGFTTSDALRWAVGVPIERQDRGAQTRVGIALRRLGYHPGPSVKREPRRYPFAPKISRE